MIRSNFNKQNRTLLLLILSILITISFFYYLRSSVHQPGMDYGVDVYYHIKAGDLFPFISTTKEFPWAQMSIWKTNFYDKELGFHAIIYMLRLLSPVFGFSLNAPFHYIDMFFVSIIIILASVGGYFSCNSYTSSTIKEIKTNESPQIYKSKKTKQDTQQNSIISENKFPFILIPPLLIFISTTFFDKLNMIRPHLLSIILFLFTIFTLISEKSLRTKCILIFIIAWIYTICYSVPHIIFIPIISYIIAITFFKPEKKNASSLLLILLAALGIAAGLLIHPQFPNTYTGWYIQGVQVVRTILGINKAKVVLGVGLTAPTAHIFLYNILIYFLLIINIVLILMSRKKSNSVICLFIIQLIMLIGFFFSRRCIEYAVPAGILCFTFAVYHLNHNSQFDKVSNFINKKTTLTIIFIVFMAIMVPINYSKLNKSIKLPPCTAFNSWAAKNIKSGTYIGLLHWGDFPRLFYGNQQFKYSMALDPMFSYYLYPEKTNKLEQFRLLQKKLSPDELFNILGTNLVYASKFDHIAIMHLIDNGAQVLYYDNEGCLLKLN